MQLSENWTLCYNTSRVCSWTGTKSTCSLATHLHLNEYDTDCLVRARVCVCVCLHLLLIYWLQCQGFLVSITRVCLPKWPFGLCFSVFALCSSAVSGGLNLLRIWLKKRPLSIKVLNTLKQHDGTGITCTALSKPHVALCCVLKGMNLLPFSTQQGTVQTFDSNGWILRQGNQVQPQNCSF